MDMNERKQIFQRLFCDVDGHALSSAARAKLHLSSTEYVYGEILPETFQIILEKAHVADNELFYDLGSGVGKAVLWAALSFPFKKAVGIELIEDIHQASKAVLKNYQEQVRPLLPLEKQSQEVDFIQADFCEVDLSNADVLFIHATCFTDDTMNRLVRHLTSLKPGARVITATKHISSPAFELIHSKFYRMGWGEANIYIYKRLPLSP